MKFSVNLIDKSIDINQNILTIIKKHLEKTINKSLYSIEIDIKNLVSEALISEPEYSSLKSGTLKAELGISNPSSVDNIVLALVNTLQINPKNIIINNNGLSGGFVLTMIKSDDISGIIYSDDANVIDSERGYSLPWLEWLLLKGNDTIIQNYSVNYTSSQRSRSGLALMVESNSNWRVPTNFTGTATSNWTTRAISKISDKIIRIIQDNIENNL